jgi:RNA polymerase sigma factor (sigma-70 family)
MRDSGGTSLISQLGRDGVVPSRESFEPPVLIDLSERDAVEVERRGFERREGERRAATDRRINDRRRVNMVTLGFPDRRIGDRRTFSRRISQRGGDFQRFDRRRHSERRMRAVGRARLDRESLYLEFQPLVKRLIRQYGDCAEQRMDLSGEIYYRFCAILEAFDPGRGVPLKPYIVRQLSASVYTYARRGWMRKRREFSYEEKAEICEPTHREDPTKDWDDKLAMDQVLQGLPDAISRLPKRQRQVVVWRYYEQRSFEDIAEILSVKTATARSLLRHGINNLRRHMGNTWSD